MGRLATLIGLLAMSVALLALTWPMVKTEAIPIILVAVDMILAFLQGIFSHLPPLPGG